MFLKCGTRKKDGQEHRSWSVVESRRGGRGVGQRHVLYLGEINDSQRAAWQKAIAVFDEHDGQTRQCALFPADRTPPLPPRPPRRCSSTSFNSPVPAPGARAGWAINSGATSRRLLRPAPGLQPRRHGLGESPAPAHALPAAFARQRMALAPALVCHHKADRIEAHLFVAFLAYCLSITLRQRLKALAGGLRPRVVFEKLATPQLLAVRVPTTDGRELLLVRRTEPDLDVALLLARLNLTLPPQPPPRISPPKSN